MEFSVRPARSLATTLFPLLPFLVTLDYLNLITRHLLSPYLVNRENDNSV
jgi:hypothetical protein